MKTNSMRHLGILGGKKARPGCFASITHLVFNKFLESYFREAAVYRSRSYDLQYCSASMLGCITCRFQKVI